MKTILLALLFSVGMACTALAQGTIKNNNEQMAFGGFGYYVVDENTKENLIAFRNYTDNYLEVRVEIKEIDVDTVYTLAPYLDYEVFSLGYNLMSVSLGSLPQLHVTVTSLTPEYDFVLRFTVWGRKFNKFRNKP